MNREKMLPTKHQHLCSEHFTPSCFEWRWGVRYLKSDAVPTIFQHTGNSLKRKNLSKMGVRKKLMIDSSIVCNSPAPQAVLVRSLSEIQDLKTLAFSIDPCQSSTSLSIGGTQAFAKDLDVHRVHAPSGSVNLLPVIQIVEPFQGVSFSSNTEADIITAPEPTSGLGTADTVAVKQLDIDVEWAHGATEGSLVVASEENLEGLPVSFECTAPTGDNECSTSLVLEEAPATYSVDEINWPGALIIENVSINPSVETDVSALTSATAQQLQPHLGVTAPEVSPVQADAVTLVTVLPETVLSSAISAPIASTLPIVSNHANTLSPGSFQHTGSKVAASLEESQLENLDETTVPLYLGSSVTNEQLVALAVSLQKKVKLLQQRHRRHRAKIKSLERIVEELKKENLISEEKLKMLETACLQSNMEVPETGGYCRHPLSEQ
ncbi:THAP domain-containing protein 5-like isoform X2 [Lissotriton helveticus]